MTKIIIYFNRQLHCFTENAFWLKLNRVPKILVLLELPFIQLYDPNLSPLLTELLRIMNSTSALSSDFFYDQLTELAAQQNQRSRSNSNRPSSENTPSNSESQSDEDVQSIPDQSCREVVKKDHPFLKYAVKLGYDWELAEDALSRLGASASTDSLLKAVLYSYAALNPSCNRRSRNNRRHYNNHNRKFNHHHHRNQYMSNGKPFPSYMATRDSYQRFNGHHPEISALRSALSQGPISFPQMKPISPPNSQNDGVYTSQNNDPYDLNVNADPFQPFAYSLGLEYSPDIVS